MNNLEAQIDNYLLVGDPHVRKDNLEESKKLLLWIKGLSEETKSRVIFFGDQHDGHGNVRVEVLEFWDWAYRLFLPHKVSLTITGNHDMNMECTASALAPNRDITQLIDKEPKLTQISRSYGIYAIPYVKSSAQFEQIVSAAPADCRTILCHQEFNGAQYENGFYAPGGVNLSKVPEHILFVSGHIHKSQVIPGRVVYIGTPRHLTSSDIGSTKGVHLWRATADPKQSLFQIIQTPESVCETMKKIVLTPENANQDIPNSSKVVVEVSGPEDFVKKACSKLPDQVKVRTLVDSPAESKAEIKESEGINVAFAKYLGKYVDDKKIDPIAAEGIKKKVFDLCPKLR